jgi:hypothetical protein
MNTKLIILISWLAFLVVVYAFMFYDIYAAQINIRERWQRIYFAFTEEE